MRFSTAFAVFSALLPIALAGCATPAPLATEAPLSFPEPTRLSVSPAADAPRLWGVTTYFGGHLPVFVGPSAVPQVLHFSSFNIALWHVYLLPGANVTAIYVSGFDPQQVVIHRAPGEEGEPPPRVVNLGRNLISHRTLSFGPPTQLEDRRMAAYRDELRTVTGLELTDFQGRWQVHPREAFLLDVSPVVVGPPDIQRLRALFPAAFTRSSRPASADFAQVRRDLAALIARGDLPPALPLWADHLGLDEDRVPTWPVLPQVPATTRQAALPADCGEVQLGTGGDDILHCDWGVDRIPYAVGSTHWVVGGDGDDLIVDDEAKGQVLSGGHGNDIINTGFGNEVIHFGRDWGSDVLVFRCNVQRREWEENMPYNPRYRTGRYIVFGRGIRPSDLEWTGPNELLHRPSGNRILFYDWPCAHFLAVERGQVPPAPGADLTERWRQEHLRRRRGEDAPPPIQRVPSTRD